MRSILPKVTLLVLLSAAVISAQFDRAKAETVPTMKKNVESIVRALDSSSPSRDAALAPLEQLAKDITFTQETLRDVPGILNDGGMRDQGTKVKEWQDALAALQNRTANLDAKVRRVGESYSSELSAFKSGFEEAERKYADANEMLLRAAGALRRVCRACLSN